MQKMAMQKCLQKCEYKAKCNNAKSAYSCPGLGIWFRVKDRVYG